MCKNMKVPRSCMMSPNPPQFPEGESLSPETETSFGDILAEHERRQQGAPSEYGRIYTGRVIDVRADAVFVDIGRKQEGAIPPDALRGPDGEITVKPGDELPVTITGRDSNGLYMLSAARIEVPKDWTGLQRAFESKAVISGTVEELTKGGLRVDVGVRAFLPASRSGTRDAGEMEKLVGQQIECIISELDVKKEDVVVDRRAVLEQQERLAREAVFAAIQEDQVVTGKVRSLTDYGAFIDLGGFDGLLHVSDMSWSRIGKPEELLNPGDTVQVRVLKVNRETRKVSLGMKQLQPDPWTLAAESFKPGDRIRGKVVRLTDFGAFVELAPGVEGLIHLSEMSWSKKARKPSDVLKAGEMVETVILTVNPAEKRIGLGLKQALGDPWEEAPRKYPVGSVIEREVTSLTNFGAFLQVEDGIEGMIHIGDITREKRLNHPREALAVGQKVRAQILEIDGQRRRIRLGMKQLEPTSAEEFISEHKVGDIISGRVAEVSGTRARIEVGEGVTALCRLPADKVEQPEPTAAEAMRADVSALGAMLSARWKGGAASLSARAEAIKTGQVRTFRITALDPEKKQISLEPA